MIAVKELTKKYNQKLVVNDVSLKIRSNEILALIGPSGCGKTTFLRLLAGLESPDKGQILINDVVVSTPSYLMLPNKRNLSMIFQDLALWPHMTAEEHIKFVLKKKKISKDELLARAWGILRNVNLEGYNKRFPHQLSGGEKQRLAIARGIASDPNYLLMDEPFSNLDTFLKDELEDFLVGLRDKLQMGIVYVSHNINEVSRLAERIAVMKDGELIQMDIRDRLFKKPENGFVRKLLKL